MKSLIVSAMLVAIIAISAAEIAEVHGGYAALLMIVAAVATFTIAVIRTLRPWQLLRKDTSWKL